MPSATASPMPIDAPAPAPALPRPRLLERRRGDGTRIVELDALRGVAALSVCINHYSHRYDKLFDHPGAWADWLIWRNLHNFGVPLFFIISGFVIPMTMDSSLRRWARDDTGARWGGVWRPGVARALWEFAVARFARLYPAFIVASVLIFLVVRTAGLPGRGVFTGALAAHLSFFPRVLGFRFVDGVYWTLETELFFYTLLFAVTALGLRRLLVPVLAALVVIDVVFPGLPEALKLGSGGLGATVFGYWHFFLTGVVFYQTFRPEPARGGSVLVRPVLPGGTFKPVHFAVLGLCLYRLMGHRREEDSIMLALIAAAVWFVTRRHVAFLTVRPLASLGAISYGLYLVHQNIGYVIIRAGYARGLPGPAAVLIAVMCVLVLASAMTFLVERPANRVLRGVLMPGARGRRGRAFGAARTA